MQNRNFDYNQADPHFTASQKTHAPLFWVVLGALFVCICLLIALIVFTLTRSHYETTTQEPVDQTETVEQTETNETNTQPPAVPVVVETEYVKQWPAGFPTDHELYQKYSAVPTSDANATEYTCGYLYWHWCRGSYTSGPINRTTSPYNDGKHVTFHAYYSEVPPNASGDFIYDGKQIQNPTPDGTYHHPSPICGDTYWYYVTEVTKQIATITE